MRRSFVPRAAYSRSRRRAPRRHAGDAEHTTPDQIDEALDEQQQLRSQKLGDILVARQIVTPEQLLDAIEQQARMPMVRIGEALTSLGHHQRRPAEARRWSQQQLDRSVPLGELLVRMGVVSRDDLQSALARKMGYPLVDLDSFPVEAEALRKLPLRASPRACR